MNTVPIEVVKKINDEMYSKTENELVELVMQMSETQPDLLAYLMAASEQIEIQEEKELFFFIGIVIYQIVFVTNPKRRKVFDSMLSEKEKQNEYMFNYLNDEDEHSFMNHLENIMEKYNQPHLLQYVEEIIFGENEIIEPLSEQGQGVFFFYLKTIIDALDA